jgi:ADP-heptose:LPS heptosyltransferase
MTVFVNTMSKYKNRSFSTSGVASFVKMLIIRFSSIGDLTQSLSIASHLKNHFPGAEIHFVTRADLSVIVENHPDINKIWKLDRARGFGGLIDLIKSLRKEQYTHIYDAHNNLRSFFIRTFVNSEHKLTRSLMRFNRFLLLHFRVNRFEKPFSGQRDLLKPLEKWGVSFSLPPVPQLFLSESAKLNGQSILNSYFLNQFVVLVPSAAYSLKRWPVRHWESLIDNHPNIQFVILAGSQDTFTGIFDSRKNVVNLTGKTDLMTSAAIIEKSCLVIANDTGMLHFAEQLGRKAIALMGPAPFGFPSRVHQTVILERNLSCRPCSKHGQGPCTNPIFQACLETISPEEVSRHMVQILEFSK